MSREQFIQSLEDAAKRVEVSYIATLLCQAAIRLRNVESLILDPSLEEVLVSLGAELGETKTGLIERILREWMEQNVYLPLDIIGDDIETEGTA